MRKNTGSKKSPKHQFDIPPQKLPISLSQDVYHPLWKRIIHSIENRDVEPVLEIIEKIDRQKGAPCLPHPFKKAVDTFPVKNVRQGMCNFIFFSDSNNKNQWILCQCTSFVDAIFSETISSKHKSSISDDTILNSVKRVLKKETKKQSKLRRSQKAIFAGYLLDQTRPYHHFYDQLKWMVNLETKKPVVSNSSFFSPKYLNRNASFTGKGRAKFSMFPLVIGSNQLGMKLDQYTEKMENAVYLDSLKSLPGGMINYRWNKLIKKLKELSGRNKTLTLWFGISGQKRIWVEHYTCEK